MSRSLDVLVVGGSGIDYTIRADHLPSAGHSVTGDLFLRDAGGKGLNQAVAAARLGARVRLITAVGQDAGAEDVLAALEQAGIATDDVLRAPELPTACTLICVDAQGRKQTAARPGANLALRERHVADDLVVRAAVLCAQLEIPIETVLHAARLAARTSVTFVLDAAPAADIPEQLIALADVLTANSEEAQVLSRIDVHDRESALAAARAIRLRGARCVTVGLAEGRALVSDTGEQWLPSHRVTPVDTTGAGDACAAAIAVGLAEGRSFLDACAFGHAAAALATTRLGALASLPIRAAVDALLNRDGDARAQEA
jgi:ribokinase